MLYTDLRNIVYRYPLYRGMPPLVVALTTPYHTRQYEGNPMGGTQVRRRCLLYDACAILDRQSSLCHRWMGGWVGGWVGGSGVYQVVHKGIGGAGTRRV